MTFSYSLERWKSAHQYLFTGEVPLCYMLNAPCSVSGLLTHYYTVAPSHCLSYHQLGGLMPQE